MRADVVRRRAGIAAAGAALLVGLGGCGERAGEAPSAAPSPVGAPWFEEVARDRGIAFDHRSGYRRRPMLPEIMGGGAALFDMDGDDDLDAYLVQSGSVYDDAGPLPPNRLFRNDGSGRFEDVTDGSGAEDRRYGMGVAAGDYDGDGDVDLYVTNLGRNTLLRNDGGGRFTDVTDRARVGHPGWGASAAFFDFDRDGDLDLYATNYINWSISTERECKDTLGLADYCSPRSYESPSADVLYRNEGDGTFTDVTRATGVAESFGNGLGLAAADFDGDGWQDVFVANDGMLDQLWRNQRGERFVDTALLAGVASDHEGVAKAGMGVTVGDLDDDGDLDLLVCNLFAESDSFFRNDGAFFTDVTARAGLGSVPRQFTRFGLGWVDLNNDGSLDLYQANGRVTHQSRRWSDDPFAEPNLVFRGSPGPRLVEVEPRGGTRELLIHSSRAAAFGDVDGDGGIDVLVANRDGPAYLLRNIVPERGNWLSARVVTDRGRDAEGAELRFEIGDRTLRRDVRSAYSYLASSSPRVHVGLGDRARVERVSVRWTDGTTERFGPFEANARITLRRGEGR